MSLSQCRVVLVRPHYPGNIGSTARAMKNFGLRDLVLVDPIADIAAHEARMLATNGVDILDAARIVATFDDAVADCGRVIATGGEADGTLRKTLVGTPADLLPSFVVALAHSPCALIFGPEPHGLANEEVARCHALLHIPADPDYTSLNLSLAVGIVLYELWTTARTPGTRPTRQRTPAPFAALDRAFHHLEAAFTAVSFVYGQTGPQLMDGVRHLLARAEPTPQEVQMLHGLARQLQHVAGQWRQKPETGTMPRE